MEVLQALKDASTEPGGLHLVQSLRRQGLEEGGQRPSRNTARGGGGDTGEAIVFAIQTHTW